MNPPPLTAADLRQLIHRMSVAEKVELHRQRMSRAYYMEVIWPEIEEDADTLMRNSRHPQSK